jgi:hypothetical protein
MMAEKALIIKNAISNDAGKSWHDVIVRKDGVWIFGEEIEKGKLRFSIVEEDLPELVALFTEE